ncbi:MAG: NADH-quinone oxidoreductase subunit J [Gemmatimonadales bacterium]|nr:NADH-quinone oxidoreductase subunit J [Gemmatimonadales bacterium]MDQ3427601.1 NADH-quinone oxidoreductase subunit J [Gemmatimonadota bacterium]
MTQTVFYLFAAFAVVSAALCILQRNPVSAALWLVSTMFSLAAIYVLLDAQFIAAIQVLVYAGAIMVLFLFVIMLLNLGHASSDFRGPSVVAGTLVIGGLLMVELFALWRYSPDRLAAEVAQSPAFSDPAMLFAAGELSRQEAVGRGVVGAVAAPLFQTYLVPFEITSILLLVAIIGAVVLAKRSI